MFLHHVLPVYVQSVNVLDELCDVAGYGRYFCAGKLVGGVDGDAGYHYESSCCVSRWMARLSSSCSQRRSQLSFHRSRRLLSQGVHEQLWFLEFGCSEQRGGREEQGCPSGVPGEAEGRSRDERAGAPAKNTLLGCDRSSPGSGVFLFLSLIHI